MQYIEIPQAVDWIISKLSDHGYEAYAVGGCVRDTLLGKEPYDWDITTSAFPEQVKEIFGHTIDTGIQHGTVTIMKDHVGYEVTTYRIDGEYEDGRHPKSVEFTSNLLEDLKRRDFTINAMAYSHRSGIVDAFDGIGDLKMKVIRCVGNPMERFTEDALRILRAVRFGAQLGFSIEKDTWNAIKEIAPNLKNVSKERIQTELTKLLCSNHPDHIKYVFETGMEPYITKDFRKLNSFVCSDQFFIDPKLEAVKSLRWAAVLRNLAEEDAVTILRELKLDNDTVKRVKTLVHWCNADILPDKTEVRSAMSQMEPELFDHLLQLKVSIATSKETKETLQMIEALKNEIRISGDCLCLKDLAVTGKDLIGEGMQPGKMLGEILALLLKDVLSEPQHNNREYLLNKAKILPKSFA